MNKLLPACLLIALLVMLQACASSSDMNTDSSDPQPVGKTKGQKFSECLDLKSPDECDSIINRRSSSY